jgi:hypothetical protein
MNSFILGFSSPLLHKKKISKRGYYIKGKECIITGGKQGKCQICEKPSGRIQGSRTESLNELLKNEIEISKIEKELAGKRKIISAFAIFGLVGRT